jgi:hypothetical protein
MALDCLQLGRLCFVAVTVADALFMVGPVFQVNTHAHGMLAAAFRTSNKNLIVGHLLSFLTTIERNLKHSPAKIEYGSSPALLFSRFHFYPCLFSLCLRRTA